MKKSSPFYQKRQICNCALFLKKSLKIRLQVLQILFEHLLNPTVYITHPIDSLSILTITSPYEVNDLPMKSHCTPTLSPLFSPIFLDIIAN